MDFGWAQHLGFALAFISFVWIIIAQNQMSNSWRIGINYEEKTELKKTGLFRVSRNPIFLGVIVSYIGTFLIIPNALSFAIMLLTFVILQIQVRLEEEYLKKTHGNTYVEYMNAVRRWI
ncbi:MAG: isoprenylcysteine carboxylmethyltransferase family protein [Cryomorphaceae bacterium]